VTTSAHSEYDYIIVGAGSAGCVLAARLTEDPYTRVLLLETGGAPRAREIAIPAAFSKLFKTAVDWNYSTEPEPQLHHRRLYWPRGKVLGGSSSINAMIYMRGAARDFDDWQQLGNPGWSYASVLPYFKKSEHQERGPSPYHAIGGPLHVSDLRYVNPLTRAFLAGSEEQGIAANPDFNAVSQDGVGLYQVTQKNGRRHSAYDAFLQPVLRRQNLTVLTNALATRILLDDHRQRAQGVAYTHNGTTPEASATREVLLCGGAVNSPQLLLLSGIGPADELQRLGIAPFHNLPGVGKNLQDHPMVSVGYLCKQPVSLRDAASLSNLARYLLTRRGPLSSNVAEAGLFRRTRPNLPVPDLQLLFGPAYYRNHGFDTHPEHAFGFGPTLITPQSRGEIVLRSADPLAPAAIRANYFCAPEDLRVIVEGVKLSRAIARSKSFAPYTGEELHPGPQARTDTDLEAFVRAEAQTLYHPAGTCKMGNDSMSVVDSQLRVHGLESLRVVDASIMPRVTAGNTNAPTIMIAEKAADLIRVQSQQSPR
jgi:choline dehydrogenase